MPRLNYNKRIPIIKNFLYLNFSSGRGWSISVGPRGAKYNYGLSDRKRQVSFGKGGFRYRKSLSGGQTAQKTGSPRKRQPAEEKIDKLVSKYVKKHYDLANSAMKSWNYEATAWPHGVEITVENGHRDMVWWDYHVNEVSVFHFTDENGQ